MNLRRLLLVFRRDYMESFTLMYFLTASVLLTLAPGPDNMYLLSKSLADGARSGIILAGGLVSGILFHTMLVIIGVAALLQSSPIALGLLQYIGAAYLLFLAWGAFHSKGELRLATTLPSDERGALYKRGVLMNVLNPKVLLFFLAFLPQFVNMEHPSVNLHIALLGFIFALQAFAIFSVIAIGAGHIRSRIMRKKNLGLIFSRIEGCVLTVIALFLLFENIN